MVSQGARQNFYLHQRQIAASVAAYFISRNPSRDLDHQPTRAGSSFLDLWHRPQELFKAVEKDALSLDDFVSRVVERKPCRAVHLGDTDEPSTLRWPFDFAGYALDTG